MAYDIIIIGAGHNGLTAAATLAKAGQKVLLLEKNAEVGGIAASEEFHPGYRTTGLLHDTTGVRASVIQALGLEQSGLKLRTSHPGTFVPSTSGNSFVLYNDPNKARSEIEKLSAKDAAAYSEFRSFLATIKPAVQRVLDNAPPDVDSIAIGDLLKLGGTGLALRRLGADTMMEIMRIAPTCAKDWLGEWFETDILKAALVGPAMVGNWLGPWSAGTTATLLMRETIAGFGVEGGPASLVKALMSRAKSFGVEIRTEAEVTKIRASRHIVQGVTLANGEEINAKWVCACCHPTHALLDLVPARQLPVDVADDLRIFRSRGTTAKLNLALNSPLTFEGRDEQFEFIHVGESINGLEQAFDAIKYGEFSKTPYLNINVPTVSDASLAPKGHHVAQILVHFAPHALRGGWTDEARAKLIQNTLDTLAKYVPELESKIVGQQLLTPTDLEKRYNLVGGHVHHGEHALDQLLFMRPGKSCGWYLTPIKGLAVGSSGSHPGGGITCAPGYLAAEAIARAIKT